MKKSSAIALGIVLLTAVAASALTTIRPFRASGGVQMVSTPGWNGPDGGGGIYYKADQGLAFHSINGVETVLGSGGGGVSFPLQNGSSATSLNYGGTMTGSSTAYTMDSTNAYTTGDVALSIKSAGTSALKIGFNFGAAFPEIQSTSANLLMLNSGGDGWAAQGANFSYWYGAGNTQVEFLANNGMRPVSSFPLYNGTVAAPWSYTAANWSATPLGTALTSASTITPTTALHHVTGTVSVSTIAVTNLPTSFGGTLTLICDAACVFATGGNISVGFTGIANESYDFTWDGTAWRPRGAPTIPAVDNVTPLGSASLRYSTVNALTLTAGSTGLTLTGGSTAYLINATGFDLSGAGAWTIASQNATSFGIGKSGIATTVKGALAYFPQAVTGAASVTVTPTSGNTVKLNMVTATNVGTMTISAGTDGQELTVMVIQPASGTAATMTTTWANVSFTSAATFTATLGKRDIYSFIYDGTSAKWYERFRDVGLTN